MPLDARDSALLRFDGFEVDLRAGELHKSKRKIKLQEQPFQILAILLEQPGEVVTREELQKRLWPADTFVDFDHSLNTAIKKLRHALGDDADKPRFVETLPRRGYRFIGHIEESGGVSRAAKASAPALVGKISELCDESGSPFLLVPVDEDTFKEREKLETANDDLGLSLLVASKKLLLVPSGTQVKVLAARQVPFGYEVRILDGEHIGLTALVPLKHLKDLP